MASSGLHTTRFELVNDMRCSALNCSELLHQFFGGIAPVSEIIGTERVVNPKVPCDDVGNCLCFTFFDLSEGVSKPRGER